MLRKSESPALARTAGISVTRYQHAKDNRGERHDLTDWADFCRWLRELLNERARDKKQLPALGPYVMHRGATRSTEAVARVTLTALDIDRDLPDVAALLEALRGLELTAFVHASPSDPTPESRKVRVYVPVTRAITPAECGAVRRALAEALDVAIDTNTLDPARIFFAGALDGSAAREVWEIKGDPLDVDLLLEGVDLDAQPERRSAQPANDRDLTDVERADLDRAAQLIEPHYDLGQRNALALAIGGWLRNAGLPPSAAEHLVPLLPSDDPDARVRDALRAWDTDKAAGWSKLAEYLPAEAATDLQALRIGPSALRDGMDRVSAGVEARRAERQRERERRAEPTRPDKPSTAGDLLASLGTTVDLTREPKPIPYVVPGLQLGPGKISALAGYAGTGKGPLLALLAVCLASGKPFLELPVRRSRVIVWDCETGPLAPQRLQRIARALGVDLPPLVEGGWLRLVDGAPPITTHLETLRALGRAGTYDVLIVDSLTSASPSLDQNAAEYAGPAWELGTISNETGVTIVVAAHDRKGKPGQRTSLEQVSGHNSIVAAMQSVISIARPDDDNRTTVELRCTRSPEEGFAPLRLRWEDVPAPHDESTTGQRAAAAAEGRLRVTKWGLRAVVIEGRPNSGPAKEQRDDTLTRRIVDCLDRRPEGCTQRDVLSAAGSNWKVARERLLQLVDDKVAEVFNVGRYDRYRLAHPTPKNLQARLRCGLTKP